jgi:DNA-binding transcriptional LysR family regulator
LVKTFLEVVACDSFAGAANRLFVSQSAVSLRIKSLEAHLGRPVFIRSKTGITLTPAGHQFVRYANSFLQVWEEAKQQVAVPEKYEDVLVVAGEDGLWNRFLIRWVPQLAKHLPKIAFRAEVGRSDRIIRQMMEGTVDLAVMYSPSIRPGITVEPLFEDVMVMVSTDANTVGVNEQYIYVDWGEAFSAFHKELFPADDHARMTFRLGNVTLNYLLNNGGSAFMPLRLVEPYVRAGKLFLVEELPRFHLPVHVAWRNDIAKDVLAVAIQQLRKVLNQLNDNELPAPFWLQDVKRVNSPNIFNLAPHSKTH